MSGEYIRPLLAEYEARHQHAHALKLYLRTLLNTKGSNGDPTDESGGYMFVESHDFPGWDVTIFDNVDERHAQILAPNDLFILFEPIAIAFFPSNTNEKLTGEDLYNEPVGIILVGSNAVFIDGVQMNAADIEYLHADIHDLCF